MDLITVYTMPNCKFCKELKEVMKKHNIEYYEIIPEDRNQFYDSIEKELSMAPNIIKRTMPKVVISDPEDHSRLIIPSSVDMINLIESGYFL